MDILKGVEINYIDSETGKCFKTVPKHHTSSFHKLTLVSNEYKMYCEPIDTLTLDSESFNDCDAELLIEYIKQELSKSVIDRIYSNTKVAFGI